MLDLDPDDYPGGIGVWNAMAPVYDTTNREVKTGVHVHARLDRDADDKAIDQSYDIVSIYRKDGLYQSKFQITEPMTRAYYLASYMQNELKSLACSHCGEPHLDTDFYAVKKHRRHLCQSCGRLFNDKERAISNPLVSIQGVYKPDEPSSIKRSTKKIDLKQIDRPGGIQLWGSNRAVLWTVPRSEEEGIHVHSYRNGGEKIEDDTYGTVLIDGIELDERMFKQLMAQRAIPNLVDHVVSLECSECHTPHFDRGLDGFIPRTVHKCAECGNVIRTRRKTISNPMVKTLQDLRANAKGHNQS